jgi:hypothetical protein
VPRWHALSLKTGPWPIICVHSLCVPRSRRSSICHHRQTDCRNDQTSYVTLKQCYIACLIVSTIGFNFEHVRFRFRIRIQRSNLICLFLRSAFRRSPWCIVSSRSTSECRGERSQRPHRHKGQDLARIQMYVSPALVHVIRHPFMSHRSATLVVE